MAARCDATTDNLIRSGSIIDFNSTYTIMFWLYWIGRISDTQGFCSISRDGASGFEESDSIGTAFAGNQTRILVYDGGSEILGSTGTTLSANNWYHVCMRRNSVTAIDFILDGAVDINGSHSTVTSRTAATRMTLSNFWDGADWGGDSRFYAYKAWAADLTLAEILTEMRCVQPRRFANLNSWYPLFTGKRTVDYGPNRVDWTEEGTWADEHGAPIPWGGKPTPTIILPSGASLQTITPTGIPSAEAFGNATVTTGPVTVSPTAIASAEVFGSPTVTTGPVTVSPTAIASAEAFGSATVTTGPVTVSPTAIASAEALGSPTITTGPVTVSPTGITSAEAFGNPTVTLETITISPTAIASAEAFGNATVTVGAVTVSPTAITSAEAFGTPVLTATIAACTWTWDSGEITFDSGDATFDGFCPTIFLVSEVARFALTQTQVAQFQISRAESARFAVLLQEVSRHQLSLPKSAKFGKTQTMTLKF